MAEMAREKFKLGDRVKLSAEAEEVGIRCYSERGRHPKNEVKTGVVKGFSTDYTAGVRVLPDGSKSVRTYHMDFWEKADA